MPLTDLRPHRRAGPRRAVAAGWIAIAVTGAGWFAFDTPATRVPAPAREAAGRPDLASPGPVRVTDAAAPAPSATAEPACPHQRIAVSIDDAGVEAWHCVSTTHAIQNGSVRRYVLAAEGLSRWRLTLDAVGSTVVSARLASDGAQTHGCIASDCRGFSIGPPDRNGSRTLRIADAVLRTRDAAPREARLRAELTIADARSTSLACTMPSVAVVAQDGGLTAFCPMGGMGFELDESERYRYVFRSLEDEAISVVLAEDGTVAAVSLGRLTCRGTACGGAVSVSAGPPGDEAHARRFDFSGLSLQDPAHPGDSATLNGSFLIPGQN